MDHDHHTPGPWWADHSGERIAVYAGERRVFLGACSEREVGGRQVAAANARLIVAAPDLLDAAAQLADFFGNDGRMASVALRERLLPLLAAITRARGEERA